MSQRNWFVDQSQQILGKENPVRYSKIVDQLINQKWLAGTND